jgi:GT2 family glycosyltransferase
MSNDGYGAAMNAAAAELLERGADALLFLTQETIVAPDAVGQLLECLATDRVGAAGPILCRRSDHDRVWSAGGRLAGVRRAARHVGSDCRLTEVARITRQVDWLDGACLLIPAEAFRECGGFRADLFLYWEDVDICRRLRCLGWQVSCVGAALAYQEPAMAPPYLNARNRALVLGVPGVLAGAFDIVKYTAADGVRGRGLRRAWLASRGLRDARRHRLDPSIALDRVAP